MRTICFLSALLLVPLLWPHSAAAGELEDAVAKLTDPVTSVNSLYPKQ